MLFYISKEDSGSSVRDFLRLRTGFSRRLFSWIKKEGIILLNGETVETYKCLREGDCLEIDFPTEKTTVLPEIKPLDILYEDEFFIAVNKPGNIPCHPSVGHRNCTLANYLVGYFTEKGKTCGVHIPGRLDKGTTGIVLAAKNKFIQNEFVKMYRENKVKKVYFGLVEGICPEEGVVDAPIARAENSILQRKVSAEGQRAVTRFYRMAVGKDFSFVKFKPETGRTHQIRVHMAHIGHPLLGDWLYGTEKSEYSRHMLHLGEVEFSHPVTGRCISIKASLPEDMENIYEGFCK